MPAGLIGPDDRIDAIVRAHPRLLEVLLSLSPRFHPLKNPALLKTVGRLTTVGQAAKTAGLHPRDVLYALNEAIGRGDEYLAAVRSQALQGRHMGTEPFVDEPPPSWASRAETWPLVDLRTLADEPFPHVMRHVAGLRPDEGMTFLQSFPPLPLASHLRGQGFSTWIRRSPGEAGYLLSVYKEPQP